MTLKRTNGAGWALDRANVARLLITIAAVAVVTVALYALFGPTNIGPTFEVVPDPAGHLPY